LVSFWRFFEIKKSRFEHKKHRQGTLFVQSRLYPSPGLFYFRVADPALMSAIFRAYNHPLHSCNTTEQGYRDVTGTSRINGR
jgi:hypothetical protein